VTSGRWRVKAMSTRWLMVNGQRGILNGSLFSTCHFQEFLQESNTAPAKNVRMLLWLCDRITQPR
jgi:hypothetical protein